MFCFSKEEQADNGDTGRKRARARDAGVSWKTVPEDDDGNVDVVTAGERWSLRRPHTDEGNAERIVHRHGSHLRFVKERKEWIAWNGTAWVDGRADAVRCAIEVARHLLGAARQLEQKDDQEAVQSFARASESAHSVTAALRLAQTHRELIVREADLDAHPMLLNVKNGILDLKVGGLLPHLAQYLMTKMAPVEYVAGVGSPLWLKFLEETQPDPEMRAYVRRVIGYSLTGDARHQCLFLHHGLGANGKSVFNEIVQTLLGDYARTAQFSTFTERTRDSVRNDVARLAGARFVSCVEMAPKGQLAEALIKQMTGGDLVTARFLYGEYFQFYPVFKLHLIANEKPRIVGTGPSMYRRVNVIPWNQTIPEDERDPELTAKLRLELPGILNWALEGCLEWQRLGDLAPPAAVTNATEEYRQEQDPLAGFFSDCCEMEPASKTTVREFYTAYVSWAQANGEKPVSEAELRRLMGERGFKIGDRSTHGQTVWRGIRLRTLE